MKTKYCFLLLACLACYSCRDDHYPSYSDASERERMTMFRIEKNSGFPEDPEHMKSSGLLPPNTIYLVWYGVDGCAGYHIRMKMGVSGTGPERWIKDNVLIDTIVGPDALSMKFKDLQYMTEFHFAIRTLSKKGCPPTADKFYTAEYEDDPYHSRWYGYGDGANPDDYYQPRTQDRPGVPEIIGWSDRTETSVVVNFNLDVAEILSAQPEFDPNSSKFVQELNPLLEIDASNKFVMHYLILEPSTASGSGPAPQPVKHILTAEDRERGWVMFDGLIPNAQYVVNGVNENIKIRWDGYYNTEMVRMRGPLGEPVTIQHKLYTPKANDAGEISDNEKATEALSKKYNACRIDDFLNEYMTNTDYAEGTVFLLEPGKTYFMNSGINISKGLTLKCADENNRPTVLMGVGFNDPQGRILTEYDYSKVSSIRAYNLSFGRNPNAGEMGSIYITDIIIENIKFEVPNAYNYDNRSYIAGTTTGASNYFINQSSQAMNFYCDAFVMRNCDFQGMIRGFIRVQGPNRKVFHSFMVENCLIYNCGAYDDNGAGYPVIAEDGNNVRTNLFENMVFRNNSFINSPYGALFNLTNNNAWPADCEWNVTLENNTFVNFSARSGNRSLFNLNYPPRKTKFTVRKNLIIICPARGETAAAYYSAGMYIRSYPAGISFDISDNYSTNVFPGTAASIFTSYPFNSTTTGGGYQNGTLNASGLTGLNIELGMPSLAPWELMTDPYPLGNIKTLNGHKHNMEGLYYQNTDLVKKHEIFTRNIGDPRWRAKVK